MSLEFHAVDNLVFLMEVGERNSRLVMVGVAVHGAVSTSTVTPDDSRLLEVAARRLPLAKYVQTKRRHKSGRGRRGRT